jgi:hypothetical protein
MVHSYLNLSVGIGEEMGQAGNEFLTRLDVDSCRSVFMNAANSSRGVAAKMGGFGARLAGNDQGRFFQPDFAPGFDFGPDGPPDFSLGAWIERFSAGARGAGYAVQMHVWDQGQQRKVNLLSPGGLTAVHKPKQLVRQISEAFSSADPHLCPIA